MRPSPAPAREWRSSCATTVPARCRSTTTTSTSRIRSTACARRSRPVQYAGGLNGRGPEPGIALVGTLDTKGAEIAYVRDRLLALGTQPVVIDSGILGEPGCRADVAREGGGACRRARPRRVRRAGSRGAAVELMFEGVRATCLRLYADGSIRGVLCLGGAEGALLGAAAMHALPVGVPKLIVSPSASGRRAFGPFVGEADVTVMHSVVDILGLNEIARAIFDNAAAAVAGWCATAGARSPTWRALRRDHDARPDDAGRDARA